VHDPNVLPPDLPVPVDDGACDHLPGMALPPLELAATDGSAVGLDRLPGRTIVFAYPRTGVPGEDPLVDDWDAIPGARGCTPESCGFRDRYADLGAAGASAVFGLSTQDTAYQAEAAARLGLQYLLLSDAGLELTTALRLPTFEVAGQTLLKRFTLVTSGGAIDHVFYPVFPPDGHADEVLRWLRAFSAAAHPG
jgi:peroxiredoxin